MNWGRGIVIGMGLFMGFIIFLVVSLMMHRVDLESEDYYQREINFENEIKALKSAQNLGDPIKFSNTSEFVVFKVTDSLPIENLNISLIRPDDKKLDRFYEVKDTKTFLIPITELKKGVYILSISYTVAGQDCLQNAKLSLPE